MASGGNETSKRANTAPVHSLWFKKKAAKPALSKVQVPKNVYLVRVPEGNVDEDFSVWFG